MKHSERDSEGVMMVNHKDSPGLTPEFLMQVAKAFPGMDTLPPGAGTGMFEAPIATCVHCQVMVILDPKRQRQRGKCPKCCAYICDRCNLNQKLGVPCRPYKQVIEDVINQNSGNLKEI